LVSAHIRADVASVYLYESAEQQLVLRATLGLAPESIGRVRLRLNEGLVGHVFQTLEPLCEQAASLNPHYKYFPETREEYFETFLAVPLHRDAERMGVLVVQRRDRDAFGAQDVLALQILGSQLAGAIENVRALKAAPPAPARVAPMPSVVHGRVASQGYAYASIIQLDRVRPLRHLASEYGEERYTLAQFHAALEATDKELAELQQRFVSKLQEVAALVFTAHQMMLQDAQFAGAMITRIEAGENPPAAIVSVAKACIERFASLPDPYLRQKAADIEDLAVRLLGKLIQRQCPPETNWRERIIIARYLYPSDVPELHAQQTRGIIVTHGGETSHIALLARSLEIPLIIANHNGLVDLPDGTAVLLDGEIGNVYVNPSESVLARFRSREMTRLASATAAMKPQTHTRDGIRVELMANINLLSEIRLARDLKAEGIGLYRSELPFLVRPAFPTEEEQVVIYSRLIQDMPDKPITIRSLDIGGDKGFGRRLGEPEENPQLGLRSIRFSLHHPEIFQTQLRAILRAGAATRELRVVFPMIGSLEEWRASEAAVNAALSSLAQEGLPHHRRPILGMMVEVPSVVPLMREFARVVDFFSIGTNDLIQYLLGVDRGNEKVVGYYRPDHPAVLRCIRQIVEVAQHFGKSISVCGEMAHDLRFAPFFLGIGVRTFSVDPRYLPALQSAIGAVDSNAAEILAAAVLRCGTSEEVERILVRYGGTIPQSG